MSTDVNINMQIDDMFDMGNSNEKNNQQTKKVVFNADNYLNTRLNDNETTRDIRIRIILTRDIDGKDKVGIPIQVHSIKLNAKQKLARIISNSDYKSFICLNDEHLDKNEHDKGCPLCNKKSELFAEANECLDPMTHKAICKQAYKFDSKKAYIVRCIERGKESEGVKFWRFNDHKDGSGIMDKLKNLCVNYMQDGVNIFNYEDGHDLILKLTKNPNPTPGAPDKTVLDIMVAVKPSKLSNNAEQLNNWINDDKDWRDMYRSKSYDYLKIVADGESPIWSKEENKFVVWQNPEEFEQQAQKSEQEAAKELLNNDLDLSEENDELPF